MTATRRMDDTIKSGTLTAVRIGILATRIALNALDCFDALAISFASPGIAAGWGYTRATRGVFLSMEQLGMTMVRDRFLLRVIVVC